MSIASQLTPRLRIEMILPSLVQAGMEIVVARLALNLAARGHDVGITCIEQIGPLASILEKTPVHVAVVPVPGLRSNFSSPPLQRHLRARKPHVVHTHSGVWLKSARAARAAKVPCVIHTIHGLFNPEPWFGPFIMRRASSLTDRITAVSEPIARYFADIVPMHASRCSVIPNGVELSRFRDAARQLPRVVTPNDRVVVGHVARLSRVKNQSLLLKAFRLVLDEYPKAELWIAGDGPLRDELQRLVEHLELGSSVRFHGSVADIPTWLRDIDVVALSSDAEGTPMCLLEAMAAGICVVATSVGGVPDLLAHGAAGVLVSPGSPHLLAGGLTAVLRDSELRYRLAEAGGSRVEECFSEAQMTSRYEAMYLSVLRGQPSAGQS